MSAPIELFFSYAHEDESLRDALAKHLGNLEWQKVITGWHDREIVAGTQWDDEIKSHLDSADIILLLISPDFIDSRYCREVEIPQAMLRHEAKQACVVPVILRPCDWRGAPFAKLQAYPQDAKAVTLWDNQDQAFLSVTQGIRVAAEQMRTLRQQQAEQKQQALSQYEAKLRDLFDDGEISDVDRDTLNDLQRDLNLTPAETQAIETAMLEPHKRYQQRLESYRQTLLRVIQHEYPISPAKQADLRQRQRDLELKPEDVTQIEQPILAEAAQRHAARQAEPVRPAPQIQPLIAQPSFPQSGNAAPPLPAQTTSMPPPPIAPVQPNPTPTYTPAHRLPKQAAVALGVIGLLGAAIAALSRLGQEPRPTPTETPVAEAPADPDADNNSAAPNPDADNGTAEEEAVPTPIAYQRQDGLFAIAFPEGYTYEETENGVVFSSGSGSFRGSVEVRSAEGQRFTTRQLEDNVKQVYENRYSEVNWQDTIIQALNKVRLDWIGRDQDGNDLDAVTIVQQEGDTVFALTLYAVNDSYNNYKPERLAILGSYQPKQP